MDGWTDGRLTDNHTDKQTDKQIYLHIHQESRRTKWLECLIIPTTVNVKRLLDVYEVSIIYNYNATLCITYI